MYDGIISSCLINCIHIFIDRMHSIVFGPDQQYPFTLPHKLNRYCSVLRTEHQPFFSIFSLSRSYTRTYTHTITTLSAYLSFLSGQIYSATCYIKKIKMKNNSNRSRCDKYRLDSQLTIIFC